MATEVAEEDFSEALANIVAVFRELIADVVEEQFAEFRSGVEALLLRELGEKADDDADEPAEPPADEPDEPDEPPADPADPAAPADPADPADPDAALRREEAENKSDAFVGERGVREVFVISGPDDVAEFVSGEDQIEIGADLLGRSGEALTDFETAVENGDLRLGEDGEATLLFTEDGVVVIEGVAAPVEADWVFV